jgi:hypothetical protein
MSQPSLEKMLFGWTDPQAAHERTLQELPDRLTGLLGQDTARNITRRDRAVSIVEKCSLEG